MVFRCYLYYKQTRKESKEFCNPTIVMFSVSLQRKTSFRVVYAHHQASLVTHMVKNLPAIQETGVQSLDREDPLEKGMATHSSVLAWRIPWTEGSGRLQSIELQRAMTEQPTLHFTLTIFPSLPRILS